MISVIIPTLNEEGNLAETLSRLNSSDNLEIIVADGGSGDATVEIAKSHGAQVIFSPKGRSIQLNRGVEASSGELLLFLHGDTMLRDGFAPLIRHTMKRPDCCAGAFSLKIDSTRLSLFLIAYCANLRSRLLQMPYGDQGIFTSRNMYDRVGGFAEVAIMEDYIFIRDIRKHGKIYLLDEAALTSARRWQNMGIIRTTLINQLIVVGYSCGVKLPTLARWYQRLKGV